MVDRIGFIGLGNVGAKLAGSLQRNGYPLTVRDLDEAAARPFLDAGASWGASPEEMAETCDVVITCLPQAAADRVAVPLELSPVMLDIFLDAQQRYAPREWSPNVIRRLEETTGLDILAPGFPAEVFDDEPEEPGYEVTTTR